MTINRVFIILILLSAVANQAASRPAGPKEKIKSMVIFEEKSDLLVKKQYKESETYFDQQGNILEEMRYDEGKLLKHFRYQYDTEGNKIKEEVLDSSGRIRESSEYRFENGLRMEKIVYDQNRKVKTRKIYIYTKF